MMHKKSGLLLQILLHSFFLKKSLKERWSPIGFIEKKKYMLVSPARGNEVKMVARREYVVG